MMGSRPFFVAREVAAEVKRSKRKREEGAEEVEKEVQEAVDAVQLTGEEERSWMEKVEEPEDGAVGLVSA